AAGGEQACGVTARLQQRGDGQRVVAERDVRAVLGGGAATLHAEEVRARLVAGGRGAGGEGVHSSQVRGDDRQVLLQFGAHLRGVERCVPHLDRGDVPVKPFAVA